MNVTVFGASGHVGRLVVKRLLADGHTVRAFVHSSNPFDGTKQLRVIRGDIHSPSDVKQALEGADAIISCLGSWHTPTKDILTSAMKTIVPVAEEKHIARLISVTGAAAVAPGDTPHLMDKINHYLLGKIAPKILIDGERHIGILSESGLNWVVVRSPVMTRYGNGTYHLDMHSPSPLSIVPRTAVATAMVDLLTDTQYDRSAPYIHPAG